MNETTINQQDVILKVSQGEIDYHTFNCWCKLGVDCFLCNLFEEKKFETWNWFAKFYCCDVIFKRCWYLRKNSQQFFDPHTTEGKVKVIIKKARRAKKEVGKRSKSKQVDKITINQGNVTSINYL